MIRTDMEYQHNHTRPYILLKYITVVHETAMCEYVHQCSIHNVHGAHSLGQS